MFRLMFIFFAALITLPLQAAPASKQLTSYRLGVFPYMPPRQTVELFGPVAASMEATLNFPVRLESAVTFPDFSNLLQQQKYDIALIQPFDYTTVVDQYGYIPLARLDTQLITQLIVRDDSHYKNIKDLRGTTIGLPPEQSANARMMLRALYEHKFIPGRDYKLRYFKSHDSCLQQVWTGEISACGTSQVPLHVFEQRMQAKFRSIYDSPPIPHTLFVAHPRIPAASRAKLQQLMINWSQTEPGRAMMKSLAFPGFVPVKAGDYAMMRSYDAAAKSAAKESSATRKEIIFGAFPFISARMLAQNFSLALPALSKSTGQKILLRTGSNFDNFSIALAAAKYDFVLVQPFDYAKAASHGYLPIAGMQEELQGHFWVLDTSPYQQIADLKGKVISMPPRDSAQSRLGRHTLLQAGLKPGRDVTINYQKNHESCIQLTQSGETAACATSTFAVGMQHDNISRPLRSISESVTIPGVIFMAHKRLPAKVREQLQSEIFSWSENDEGGRILKAIGFGNFAPVNISDYQHMPKLN